MLVAVLSDRARHRLAFTLAPIAIAVAGFAVLLAVHDDTQVQYAALFLVCMGTYGAMPVIVCWFNMNLGGHARRAVGSAWQIGFGNIGGIVATYSFLAKDAPEYKPGYGICLGFIALSAASCCAYAALITRENRTRARAGAARAGAHLPENEKAALGDLNPEFRYML